MISRKFMIIGAAIGLSACVSLLPDPAPAPGIYRLTSATTAVAPLSNAEVIRVDRPAANQIFNSTDIVVTTDGQKLSVIAQASWAEAAPVLIQSTLVDALTTSPNFIGLIPTSGARTDTRLHLSVANFEAQFDNGPESAPLAVISYHVTYARADDRKLLGTYSVKQTARAASINVSSVVSAIETANAGAMAEIVSWLETQSSAGGA